MLVRAGMVLLLLGSSLGRAQSAAGAGVTSPPAAFCGSGETAPYARVSSGTMAGNLLKRPAPIFPQEAARQHISGSVVLRVCVGEDGLVKKIAVVSGPEILRQAWIDAVSRWVYRPYLVNGVATPVDTTVSMSIAMGAPSRE